MLRFLILSGYFELMMYLQVSGKLDQYINAHYRYLAYLSMILSFLLAVVQLILWVKGEKGKTHSHLTTVSSKISAYILLAIPLFVGLCFPTVSLNASIVDTKGFHFPVSEESTGDSQVKTQYLRPDTSIYFNKGDYADMMNMVKKKYIEHDTIKITDENYLEVMEMIYDFPSEFIGKKVEYTGFYYADPEKTKNLGFLFRFGIIHCVADSGVFGLLNIFPEDFSAEKNDWVQVKGTIEMQFYKPFNRNLPAVKVEVAKKVNPPQNQYVYRSF
ncbi:putative membrane protein [Pilibacter termitis]|uniref:Putative membrane protein n=1 Tax=Pilibacter termitis TaxID=263852 RepID=A0A1T4NY24_9ENTE|nr:TIGR03943 family protein [Pilibacter termitis]SJZ83678.1 putative membrane protein [Pilibacter termitis]